MARVRPQARDDVTVVEMDGEAVVFDQGTGELHHLNPAATIVFRLCDGRTTMFEMSEDIAEVTGLAPDEVQRQVRTTVRQLRKAELLTGAAAPAEVSRR